MSDDAPREWDGKPVIPTDTWRVIDRWWTEEPVDRTCVELELEDGSRIVIYKEKEEGVWREWGK